MTTHYGLGSTAAFTSPAALSRRVNQLARLAEVSKLVASELELEPLLQQVVDAATHLLDAALGGLLVYDVTGKNIEYFKVTGWSYSVKGYPTAAGILGIPYREMINLRSIDIAKHPSFSGFPPGHPTIAAFLSVPLMGKSEVLGTLFVGNQPESFLFRQQDEELLMAFATQATIAIQNARLYAKADELARLQERQRISQALHDTIAQQLFSIGLESEWCHDHLDDQEGVEARLRAISRLAAHSSAQLRSSIFALRGEQLPKVKSGSLVQLIAELVTDFETQTGTPTILNATPCFPTFPTLLTEAVYRIVLESLNNIKKHASATGVIVSLDCDTENVTVTIQDNGVGLSETTPVDPKFGHLHFGMETMRNVTAKADGSISITNNDDEGVMVKAQFPILRKET